MAAPSLLVKSRLAGSAMRPIFRVSSAGPPLLFPAAVDPAEQAASSRHASVTATVPMSLVSCLSSLNVLLLALHRVQDGGHHVRCGGVAAEVGRVVPGIA